MKIKVYWVGKTRQRYLAEGIRRYQQLLIPMALFSITEVREEKGDNREKIVAEEGRRILRQTTSYALLDERGREFSSLEFARFLSGRPAIDFVIGGAFGVSGGVREGAAEMIALSRMTFTHELTRLIFLEQLYRALTIMKGKEYHH